VNDSLLIVGSRSLADQMGEPMATDRLDDAMVTIAGVVHSFDVEALAQQLGLALDADLLAEYAGQPALVASSIRLTPYRFASQGLPVGRIVDEATMLYGQEVAVTGDAGFVEGAQAFTLRSDDVLRSGEVPVLLDQSLVDRHGRPLDAQILIDRHLQVTGTVQQLDTATIERLLTAHPELDSDRVAAWADGPLIVARSVQIAPIAPLP
jgi:hypothetical protein